MKFPVPKLSLSVALLVKLALVSSAAQAGTPAAPQNPRGVSYSGTAGELFWDRVNDADSVVGYRVYLDSTLLREVDGPSLFVEGLQQGQTYTYTFTAVDALGFESDPSRPLSFVSGSDTGSPAGGAVDSPGAPVSTGAVGGNVPQGLRVAGLGENSLTIAWQAPRDSGTYGYNVYLDNNYLTTTFSTSNTINSLVSGTNYSIYLTAFDEDGNFSVASDAITVSVGQETPDAQPAPPSPVGSAPEQDVLPVQGLQVTGTSNSSVSVTWQAAGDGYGYNVYLDNNYLATTFSNSYTINSLASGATHSIYVTAFNEAGKFSTASGSVTASVGGGADQPVQPPAPEPEGDATGGPVEEDDTPVTPQSDPAPQVDFFNAGLEFDSQVPTPGGPPTRPKNLRANLIGNDWVELNWAASRDDGRITAYRVYRDDGVNYSVTPSNSNPNSHTNYLLRKEFETTTMIDCNFTHVRSCKNQRLTPQVGTTHTYQVSAIDNAGNESARSNSLTVKFHKSQGATIEPYSDPYIDPDDQFQFVTDLSNTANFMDQFELVFSDEFNGTEIDASKWTTSLTWRQEDQNIINRELQYFVDTQRDPDFGYDPFVFTGETMKISAIRTPPELSERALGQPFLSGALSTHELRSGQLDSNGNVIPDKYGATYGYVEGRMRVGEVTGMLSSFYLFRRWEGEHSPEIDIVEYLGGNPFGAEKAFQTYHYRDTVHGRTMSSPTMEYPRGDGSGNYGDVKDLNQFHTYSVLWEPNLVIWYIDGEEIQRLTGPQISRQSMNIILYLVTGSAWAPRPSDSAPFPLEMEIDYVRAYKRKPWQQ